MESAILITLYPVYTLLAFFMTVDVDLIIWLRQCLSCKVEGLLYTSILYPLDGSQNVISDPLAHE